MCRGCRQLRASEARRDLAQQRPRSPADHFGRATGRGSARAAGQRRDQSALSIGHRMSRGGRNRRELQLSSLGWSAGTKKAPPERVGSAGRERRSGSPAGHSRAEKGCRLHGGARGSGGPPGRRNGQYRHDERIKAAIAEQRKFNAC